MSRLCLPFVAFLVACGLPPSGPGEPSPDMAPPDKPVVQPVECAPDEVAQTLDGVWREYAMRWLVSGETCGTHTAVAFQPCNESTMFDPSASPYMELRVGRLVGKDYLVSTYAYQSNQLVAARATLNGVSCRGYVANGRFSCISYGANARAWCLQ